MSAVTICECFARDGLQHEQDFVPTATKRALIERFAALGFTRRATSSGPVSSESVGARRTRGSPGLRVGVCG